MGGGGGGGLGMRLERKEIELASQCRTAQNFKQSFQYLHADTPVKFRVTSMSHAKSTPDISKQTSRSTSPSHTEANSPTKEIVASEQQKQIYIYIYSSVLSPLDVPTISAAEEVE